MILVFQKRIKLRFSLSVAVLLFSLLLTVLRWFRGSFPLPFCNGAPEFRRGRWEKLSDSLNHLTDEVKELHAKILDRQIRPVRNEPEKKRENDLLQVGNRAKNLGILPVSDHMMSYPVHNCFGFLCQLRELGHVQM